MAAELIYQHENGISPDSDTDEKDYKKTTKVVGELEIRGIDVSSSPIKDNQRDVHIKITFGRKRYAKGNYTAIGCVRVERLDIWQEVNGQISVRFPDGKIADGLETDFGCDDQNFPPLL
ncbi:MAG: hypothetical protein ABR875_00665 [Minisyncoccia bacterium]|jgi:hypothetical protein